MIDQAGTLTVTPTDAELERAIGSVPGVVTARIERPQDTGRSRMRLRLAPGEDEEAVAWAVAATLRERFGIALDPDAIRPRHAEVSRPSDDPVRVVHSTQEADVLPTPDGSAELEETRARLERAAAEALDGPMTSLDESTGPLHGQPASAEARQVVGTRSAARSPSAWGAIPRPAIEHLEIRRETHAVEVIVTLEHDGRSAAGHVESVPTSRGTLRAVAEATVAALRVLTEGPLLVGIDRVSVREDDDGSTATVMVSLLTRRGEERLVGASLVRNDPERAVLRATLDALNRRVTPLLLERASELDLTD